MFSLKSDSKSVFLFSVLLIITTFSCAKPETEQDRENETPTVRIASIGQSDLTYGWADVVVISEGRSEVTERGICLDSTGTPDINSRLYPHGTKGIGSFSVDLTGLSPKNNYYVRAYAKNEAGVGYSDQIIYGQLIEDYPKVITESNYQSDFKSITIEGNITLTDPDIIFAHNYGFFFGKEPSPELTGSMVDLDKGSALPYTEFSTTIEDLEPNTTYKAKTYMFDPSEHYFYGNEIEVKTKMCSVTKNTTVVNGIEFTIDTSYVENSGSRYTFIAEKNNTNSTNAHQVIVNFSSEPETGVYTIGELQSAKPEDKKCSIEFTYNYDTIYGKKDGKVIVEKNENDQFTLNFCNISVNRLINYNDSHKAYGNITIE